LDLAEEQRARSVVTASLTPKTVFSLPGLTGMEQASSEGPFVATR